MIQADIRIQAVADFTHTITYTVLLDDSIGIRLFIASVKQIQVICKLCFDDISIFEEIILKSCTMPTAVDKNLLSGMV